MSSHCFGCIAQAHYPSSYSNQPGSPVYSYIPPSSEAYPARLKQLLKYQPRVWGAPREFRPTSHQVLPTVIQTTYLLHSFRVIWLVFHSHALFSLASGSWKYISLLSEKFRHITLWLMYTLSTIILCIMCTKLCESLTRLFQLQWEHQ